LFYGLTETSAWNAGHDTRSGFFTRISRADDIAGALALPSTISRLTDILPRQRGTYTDGTRVALVIGATLPTLFTPWPTLPRTRVAVVGGFTTQIRATSACADLNTSGSAVTCFDICLAIIVAHAALSDSAQTGFITSPIGTTIIINTTAKAALV